MPPQTGTAVGSAAAAAAAATKISREEVAPLSDYHVQVDDSVYDAQSLASIHPGGELFVKAFAGRDATEAFLSYHRREFPHARMKQALVGSRKALKTPEADKEYLELCKLVEQVLPRNKSFAPVSYFAKVFVILGTAVGLEYYIHSQGQYRWYLTALLGWLFALIGLNIQHDANHGAISRYGIVNRLLGLTQNWIGGSAVDWIHQHVVQHHIHPNDVENDPDIVGNVLLRLNPLHPVVHPTQLYQHVYVFVLLFMFGFTYILDSLRHNIEGFHYTKFSKMISANRTFEECTIGLFFARWLVLPLIMQPSIYTLLNVLPLFMAGGFYLSFFFVISHNFEGVHLFQHKYLTDVEPSFLRKQVTSGSNVGGSWLCFLNGGLNYQIEHHLFPRIQHAHYPTIAPVVREFCKSRGIPYVHFPTVADNVSSCVRHLYQMGHNAQPKGFQTAESRAGAAAAAAATTGSH